ncbi:ferritin heavy chain-like [Choloepus didactylus]|uniref:ferritin heavy chain-like n=1 Tax=Choloepus didactylus TaxID=27675 RepID=UPI00189EE07C|nr:ferritin heavy chain-like [Choloepus didactylus]
MKDAALSRRESASAQPPASAAIFPAFPAAPPQPPPWRALPSPVRQVQNQDSCRHLVKLGLYPLVYLSMSYCFDHDDVAWKNFAKYFLPQSHEEREHAEKHEAAEARKWWNLPSGYQETRKSRLGMECALHTGKRMTRPLLELHKLAIDKNDPHLCDFVETHYLDEQVKSLREFSG